MIGRLRFLESVRSLDFSSVHTYHPALPGLVNNVFVYGSSTPRRYLICFQCESGRNL